MNKDQNIDIEEESSDSLYLEKTKYDPKLKTGFVSALINNPRLIVLAVLTLILIGVFSFFGLPREVNPQIEIPIVIVSSTYPGATPNDIEELIIKPIENEVSSINGITSIESTSVQSAGFVIINFENNVNSDKALSLVKDKVDLVKLPDDATTPYITKQDFSKIPIYNFLVVGDFDTLSIGKIAKDIKLTLEDQSSISDVETAGLIEDEITIKLDLEKIQTYGLSTSQIIQSFKANDINFPPGDVTINGTIYQVSINNTYQSIDDIRKQVININNKIIPISEIADIRLESEEYDTPVYYQKNGSSAQNSIQLRVYKNSDYTINRALDDAQRVLEEKKAEYPQVEFIEIENYAKEIDEDFTELGGNFRDTIILVFVILFIFLGLKQATTASLSIPLTILSTFVIMSLTGISLNGLSLFSLLLSLGLVVDDAIVIVTAYSLYNRSGKFTKIEAGHMVFKDFIVPIWTTTVTTIWAFVPLLLTTGIIGEFIKSIPIVVTTSLLSSTAIATLINLPVIVIISSIKIPKRVEVLIKILLGLLFTYLIAEFTFLGYLKDIAFKISDANDLNILALKVISFISFTLLVLVFILNINTIKDTLNKFIHKLSTKFSLKDPSFYIEFGLIDFRPIERVYKKLISKILYSTRNSLITLGIVVVFIILSITFVFTGLLKSEFFPKTDSEQIYINIEGPSGWDKDKLQPSAETAYNIASSFPEVKFVTTSYGYNYNTRGSLDSASNYLYLIVNLKSEKERSVSLWESLFQGKKSIKSWEVEKSIREELKGKLGIKSSVFAQSGGPPAGADIQINLFGDDLIELENLSNMFMDIMKNDEIIIDVDSSLKQSAGQIKIELNPVELAKRRLSAVEVASWLRTFITGTEIGSIGSGDFETNIILGVQGDINIDSVENLILPGSMGGYSLNEIAEIKLENTPEKIQRKDKKRIVSVTASSEGISSTEAYTKLKPLFEKIEVPSGYSWNVGGENEENQKSVQEIITLMGVSFVLILVTMILEMNSFRKAFLMLLIIPIAIAAVFFNFTIFQIPLSFPSLIGVLALYGIVVNNAIMLVEKIIQNHKIGLSFTEGIIDACASRVAAIFLTSSATILGLLPITLSDPLWQGLGGAIIAGLSVSGLLILFVLPILYKAMFKGENLAGRKE